MCNLTLYHIFVTFSRFFEIKKDEGFDSLVLMSAKKGSQETIYVYVSEVQVKQCRFQTKENLPEVGRGLELPVTLARR